MTDPATRGKAAGETVRLVRERFERRDADPAQADRYSPLRPDVWRSIHERQAATLRLLASAGTTPAGLAALRLLDVGCGAGDVLLEWLRWGCRPEHLTGVELIPERLELARRRLPPGVSVVAGDARDFLAGEATAGRFDLVTAYTVFSSLPDEGSARSLAAAMWRALAPGGAVLWYDFAVDNPRNPDVRGWPLARIRELFPGARAVSRRVTLAPPLARAACRWLPAVYPLLNALPLLRTHRLVWLSR